MEVYIVYKSQGEYEDFQQHVILVTDNLKLAEDLIEIKEKEYKEKLENLVPPIPEEEVNKRFRNAWGTWKQEVWNDPDFIAYRRWESEKFELSYNIWDYRIETVPLNQEIV